MTELPARSAPVVPEWLDHLAAVGWRVVVSVAMAAVLVYIAVLLATVTATILVSLIFAATFSPLVLHLRDRGWSRSKAAGVVTFGVLVLVVATLIIIALAFVPYIPQVIAAIQQAVASVKAALADLQVSSEIQNLLDVIEKFVVGWLTAQAAVLLAPVAQAATVGLLSLFTVFFLLQDGDKGWVWALQAGADWQRERITTAGHDALERVGGYLRGLAILAAVNAVRDFVLLYLLGVPLAGPLSVLVFILGFIPYFGSLVATVLIVIVTYATVGFQAAAIFLIAITLLNIVEGNIMMPLIYGRTVNIHPALALVAILAGGSVGGILGVFAAIPLVAFAVAVGGSLIAIIDTQRPVPDREFVPGWLDRVAQWSWRLLVAIAVLGVIVELAEIAPSVVIPVTFSLILAATFLPFVDRLVERGWRRPVAAAVATLGGIGAIVLIGLLAVVAMIPTLSEIVADSTTGLASLQPPGGDFLGWLREVVQTFGLGAVAAAAAALAAAGLVTLILIISTVLSFYFLADGRRFWAAVVGRLPLDRRAPVDAAGGKAVNVLGGYMIATGVISAFAAATQWLIMFILGIPLALPLAVLAFFGGFIPYIGSLLTTLAALLVTIAVGTPQQIAVMVVWTLVFNIVQGNVIGPLVYGRAVNIHPAIVLLAMPAGNAIAGIMGMFLAVPFIGVVAATWRTVLRVFGPVTAVGRVIPDATQEEEPEGAVLPAEGSASAG